jgi:class 3 adenylate cyclase/tetratricopeptide (TPR) repeat protein
MPTLTVSSELGPYVPRVVREWLDDDPAATHRRVEGTMVLVDISGFTRLSERLGRFGKEGAETVTTIVGGCFNRLLTDAYAFGATLLKFGGDALLLLFQDEGHAVRACTAAVEMRRTLRGLGAVDTTAGRIVLRMRVAVHTGTFDFFLVGGSHRELLVAGPAAGEIVRLEGEAATGRILLSPSTAAGLPLANVGRATGGGYLLQGPSPALDRQSVTFLESHHDLRAFVPLGLRRLLANGRAPSEHRRATVAFVHIGGIDDVLAAAGPVEAANRLDEVIGLLQHSVDERQVCFLSSDVAAGGVKVILTAGVPESDGEDEERTLLVLRRLLDRHPGLPVRVGVSTDHVVAGEIGLVHRRCYTVMGDSVNLAARLMSRAAPGEILATKPVLAASRTLFDSEDLTPFLVKGKQKPVTATKVGRPRGVRTAIAATELPLVGREGELAVALAAVEATRPVDIAHRRGQLVDIVAEPGAGKSRLLDELIARAAPIVVHRVQCRQYQAATPYFALGLLLDEVLDDHGPGREATEQRLAALVDGVAPHLMPWLSLLAVPLGLELEDRPEVAELEESFRKRQLEEAVVELLGAILRTPTIIAFEDVHWLDEASGDVLRVAERGLADRPWLLCVTRRGADVGFVPSEVERPIRIELTALPATSVRDLLEVAATDAPLPGHVLDALAERSGGSPLFALELLSALRDGGDLDALPRSVEGLISARIDRLAPEDRALLRELSVLGLGFQARHIAAVTPHRRPAPASSVARLQDFLSASSGEGQSLVRFRHALVRDVAYAGLPFSARARLHGQVAESILADAGEEADDAAALLSLHFLHARRYDAAWRYARLAGDEARHLYANLEAATQYERALLAARHLPDLPTTERAAVLEALGDVQDLAGLFEQARASYRTARRLLRDDPVAVAGLELKDAFVVERRGRYVEAIRSIRRGLRLLDGPLADDARVPKLRAQLTAWFAAVRASQGKPAEAARASRAGVAMAEAAADERALARAELVLDYAERALGRTPEMAWSAKALDIYTRLGDLSGQATATNNLGAFAYYEGRWSDAIELYEQSRAARLRAGDPTSAAMADANIGEILADQGRLAEAAELLTRVASVWSGAGDAWGVAYATLLLGVVTARDGRPEEAADLLERARAGFAAIGAGADVETTDLAIVEQLVLAGRAEEAVTRLALLDGAQEIGAFEAKVCRLRGLALLQLGDDGWEPALRQAVDVARRQDASHELAMALEVLSRAGREPGAEPEYRAIYAELGIVDRPAWPGLPAPL